MIFVFQFSCRSHMTFSQLMMQPLNMMHLLTLLILPHPVFFVFACIHSSLFVHFLSFCYCDGYFYCITNHFTYSHMLGSQCHITRSYVCYFWDYYLVTFVLFTVLNITWEEIEKEPSPTFFEWLQAARQMEARDTSNKTYGLVMYLTFSHANTQD